MKPLFHILCVVFPHLWDGLKTLIILTQYCELTKCEDDVKPVTEYEETLPLQAHVNSPLG